MCKAFHIYPSIKVWTFKWSWFNHLSKMFLKKCYWREVLSFWLCIIFFPLLFRACGISSSRIKNWRGWSNKMCWERQYHCHSGYLSILGSQHEANLCFFSICIRFPEIHYFQDDDVRTKLTDILFCYARENEQLLYKQVKLTHSPKNLFLELKGRSDIAVLNRGFDYLCVWTCVCERVCVWAP